MRNDIKSNQLFFFFVSFILFSCTSTSPQKIINKFYIEPDFTYMGAKGDLLPVQLIQNAARLYTQKEYEAAITALRKMPFTSGNYNHSVYLIACIALKQGNGQLAVEEFKHYLATEDQRFIEQGKFSLVLAYLSNNQIEEAKQQLGYIIENKNDFSRSYVERAREIQRLME